MSGVRLESLTYVGLCQLPVSTGTADEKPRIEQDRPARVHLPECIGQDLPTLDKGL